jgi:hypothetical protein
MTGNTSVSCRSHFLFESCFEYPISQQIGEYNAVKLSDGRDVNHKIDGANELVLLDLEHRVGTKRKAELKEPKEKATKAAKKVTKKSKKAAKDPNAPKRPSSGFFIFM